MVAAYSTWTYYRDTYHGKLAEDDYLRLSRKAAAEINDHTYGRAPTALESMADALRECECELVDTLQEFEAAREILPVGIQSMNNDGLQASAGAANTSGTASSRVQVEKSAIYDICRKHLLRPVNLMYAGVKWC